MLFFKKTKPTEVQPIITNQFSDLEKTLQTLIKRQRKMESTLDSINEVIEDHAESFLTQEQLTNNERTLIQIFMEQDEYIYRLSQLMQESTSSSNWTEQLNSIQLHSQQKLKKFGFRVILETQVTIDFYIHEIIDVFPTKNPEQKDKVYKIVTPGYIYGEKLLKKATIIAYKYEEENYA